MEDRRIPPSVQQTPARRVLPAGGQKPPLAPLGPGPLRPGPPARSRPPPRDPDSRPRLVPRRVAMLAQPHPIRPHATPRAATPHHRHHPQPRRARSPTTPPPSGLAGPGLWRPDLSRAASLAPNAAHPLLDSRRLTQDVFGDGPRVRRQPLRRSDRRARAGPGSARRDPRHARKGSGQLPICRDSGSGAPVPPFRARVGSGGGVSSGRWRRWRSARTGCWGRRRRCWCSPARSVESGRRGLQRRLSRRL